MFCNLEFAVIAQTDLKVYLWVRFILQTGTGPMYYCYKVNPTVPPASTNGWVGAFSYWSSGQWAPNQVPMSEADKVQCWLP